MENPKQIITYQTLLWLGLVFLTAGLAYFFWPAGVTQSSTPVSVSVSLSESAALPSALTATAPAATPTVALPVDTISDLPPLPTPPPGGLSGVLVPPAEAVGWATSLDGRSHFRFPNIHAGILDGHIYHGAFQFDLSPIPPGSTITYAALELTGLDAQYLNPGGAWQLHMIEPAIDADWPNVTYETLHQAGIDATISPVLTPAELSAGQTNLFVMDPAQIARLAQRLSGGQVSFRLDGPTSGQDNLFTWDSGYRANNEALDTRPKLRLVILPPPAPEYVVVTSTPTPDNVITVAAMAVEATTVAQTIGTYTPVPENWVTPIVVTPQPTPANAATATHRDGVATAEAFLFGTATPPPPNVWTATPTAEFDVATPIPVNLWTATPTPLFVPVDGAVATPWVASPPTATPPPIPEQVVDKIAFLSNRSGGPEPLREPLVYVVDPDGSNLAVLTDRAVYDAAVARERYSADQRFRVFVKDARRFDNKQVPTLYFYDYFYNAEEQITHFGAGAAWDPVWSPAREQIAFVSNDSGDDEIWVANRDGTDSRQLTGSNVEFNAREIGKDTFVPEINGHPSWSPDGSKIVFWSSRTGHRQIWVMDADGSNSHSLSTTNYDDWNPVWIKYIDPARNPAPDVAGQP